MPKTWGAACGENNKCWGSAPTNWCEEIGDECFCGGLGDLEISSIPVEKFQSILEASTTKFYGKWTDNGNLILEEIGMLANAGLLPGDILLGIISIEEGVFKLNTPEGRRHILQWQFTSPKLFPRFMRDGNDRMGGMDNPTFRG